MAVVPQGTLATKVNVPVWNVLVDAINANTALTAIALLSDGSVELTADWDAGPWKITAETLESDVATSTPPLVIASTTVVANLNVDQVDGFDIDQALLIASSPAFVTLTLSGALIATVDNIADGDLTPSVSGGVNFKTANSTAKTITNFDDGVNGQIINIIAGDDDTTIASNANIKHNAGSGRVMGEYDVAKFIHNGTLWVGAGYEQNSA